ncbi:hypothetical protein Tco_0072916 [Tanacetum coccineum]
MITDATHLLVLLFCPHEKKLDSEFNEERKNKLELADTQAEINSSKVFPYTTQHLNQTSTAKEIWDNVELLMQGSGRTLQQRKEDLFDEYERFRAIGNESIHDYFDMMQDSAKNHREAKDSPVLSKIRCCYGSKDKGKLPPMQKLKHSSPMWNDESGDATGQHSLQSENEIMKIHFRMTQTITRPDMLRIILEKALEQRKNLKNELLQCKQEICRLDTQKVKLDLENKVRQEQALVIQRNKRNAELEQENVLLKSALSVKDTSITTLLQS